MYQLLKGKASQILTKASWIDDDTKATGSEILAADMEQQMVNMYEERIDGWCEDLLRVRKARRPQ